MTQAELLASVRQDNPGMVFARSADGAALGVWDTGVGRFVMFLSRAITGEWVKLPYELLLDGQLPYKPDQWLTA